MSRAEEIRELESVIYRRKDYNHRGWCQSFCCPSSNSRWWQIIIVGGDAVKCLSEFTKTHKVRVVEIDGIPHTVVVVRGGFVDALKRAKNLRTFFNCLCTIIAESDIKRFHYDLWVAAHNLEANIKRLHELQVRASPKKDSIGREVDGIFSNNTLRVAAKHYGSL